MASPAASTVLDIFIKLVEIPSPPLKESRVAEFICGYLSSIGVDFIIDDAGGAAGGETGNIIATMPSSLKPSILFSAHMDTVDDNTGMVPSINLERVRSDGTTVLGADDKAGVAAILSVLKALSESGREHRDLEVVFSIAEETGLHGAKALDTSILKADYGFVFDGSGSVGNMYVRAPSQDNVTAIFKGIASHAGVAPEAGKSAITAACKAVTMINQGRLDHETTCNIGIIRGGKATNIVPDEVFLKGEARSVAPEKLSAQVAQMIEAINVGASESGISVETTINREYDGFSFDNDEEIVQMASDAFAALGITTNITASGGGSDANIFNGKGLKTLNLGIGAMNVHSVSEYIEISELENLANLVMLLAAP